MKTIQGKEFDLSDVLLYNVVKDQIIMIVNDSEQMKKFKYTGLTADAPISRVPYTKDTELEIIRNMKKIRSYNKEEKYIEVTYKDKTKSKFDLSNEGVIRSILEAQSKINADVISSNWTTVTEEKKVENKEKVSKKWKKGIIGTLAALVLIAGAIHHKDDIADVISRKDKKEDPINPEQNEEVIDNKKKTEEYYYSQAALYDFTELGKRLYAETVAKENLVLKYQQVVNINWDEDLATKVIEFMNNKYPVDLLNGTDQDASLRTTEVQQAWSLLLTSNLNPETTKENMINFDEYFIREEDRVLVHNAMAVARNAMDETIGEPMNGYILEEGDYASINKFSREYLGAVDQLLNYEYDTVRDSKFADMASGARWTISNIFQQVNNTIPQWSYITREENGKDVKIYYRCFKDSQTGDLYYAIPGENGTVDYRCDSLNKTINEYEMFAMAGQSLLEEQRNIKVNANPNMHQEGIQVLVDKTVDTAREDVFNLRYIAKDLSKTNEKGAK